MTARPCLTSRCSCRLGGLLRCRGSLRDSDSAAQLNSASNGPAIALPMKSSLRRAKYSFWRTDLRVKEASSVDFVGYRYRVPFIGLRFAICAPGERHNHSDRECSAVGPCCSDYSSSYVVVSLSNDAGTTNGYYSGISRGGYAVYDVPEFKKLRDGSYTITADYWGKLSVGFQGYGEISTSVDLPSNGLATRRSVSLFLDLDSAPEARTRALS